MDLADPATMVLTPGMAAVLRGLCGADAAFTVRQLGRVAGVSHARAAEVVNRLAEHGLVLVEEHGAGKLCRLNRDHLAAPALCDLVGLRARLIGRLRDLIASWAVSPLHASLFGSAARGDGGTGSDLDVLVVRPARLDHDAWDDQLADTAEAMWRATGNQLAWIDLSRRDLTRIVAAAEPIVGQWRADAVHLCGTDLRRLLRDVA